MKFNIFELVLCDSLHLDVHHFPCYADNKMGTNKIFKKAG